MDFGIRRWIKKWTERTIWIVLVVILAAALIVLGKEIGTVRDSLFELQSEMRIMWICHKEFLREYMNFLEATQFLKEPIPVCFVDPVAPFKGGYVVVYGFNMPDKPITVIIREGRPQIAGLGGGQDILRVTVTPYELRWGYRINIPHWVKLGPYLVTFTIGGVEQGSYDPFYIRNKGKLPQHP